MAGQDPFLCKAVLERNLARRINEQIPIEAGGRVFPSRARTDGIHAIFLCRDGLGHLAAEVKLTSDEHDYYARQSVMRQTVTLLLLTEPAAVDNFVRELETLADSREGSAMLRVVV